MTYSTLMVHLELGRPNTSLLNIAVDLAARFDAGVIGIAARRPLQMVYGDGYVSGDLYEQDQLEIGRELDAAERECRTAVSGKVASFEWRSTRMSDDLAGYLANEARSADLLVTGAPSGDFFDRSRELNRGDLLMQVGRPLLAVPAGASSVALTQALVAWKDTRESRRAVADALPMLKLASRVKVVELAEADALNPARRHVADVVAWLERHGIAADCAVQLSDGDDANALRAIGDDQGADVIVAGAYGHSRLREWVLGGVTRDLLLSSTRCALLSH